MVSNEDKLFRLCPERCQDVTLEDLTGLFHQQHTRTCCIDIITILGCPSRGAPNDALATEDCCIILAEFTVKLALIAVISFAGGAKILGEVLQHLLLPSLDQGSARLFGHHPNVRRFSNMRGVSEDACVLPFAPSSQ